MKKIASLALAAALFAGVTAAPSTADAAAKLTKVTDYLYEATYDDYEKHRKVADEMFYSIIQKMGGCSSVQNGVYRGRNYDWNNDENPSIVVRVPAKKGRHASIGVALTHASVQMLESGNYPDFLVDLVPYSTLDGMNDAGLTVNLNLVAYGELGEAQMRTEDKSDDIAPAMVTRLLLDNCGTVEEALALMSTWDIYPMGKANEFHYMITGPQSKTDKTLNTVVVELVPDENKKYKMNVIDHSKGQFVGNKPVMTNFFLTGFDGTIESASPHPMGIERWQALYDAFDQGNSVRGMHELMKKAYYTKSYDLYNDNFWYSEYSMGEYDKSKFGPKKLNGDLSKAGVMAKTIKEGVDNYNNLARDGKTWLTVHTSIYDIENKVLHVVPQEGNLMYVYPLDEKKAKK